MRRGAQKGLDDCGAFEGVSVSGQGALRLSDFPLHGHPLPLLQTELPGDSDVRLLPSTRLEIDNQSLDTPEDVIRMTEWSNVFPPTEGSAMLCLSYGTPQGDVMMPCV